MTSSLNRIFKVIWCRHRNAWVAVSELVASRGARSGGALRRLRRALALLAWAALLEPAWAAGAPAPTQLPAQGRVSAGQASIRSAGSTMTITQSSPRAAIDWNSFDIGSRATVRFVQPGASAIALNRVSSPDPSQIYGHLDANGQVYLINPKGVYFAPGASVDVGGIVATTNQMSDAAFLAGCTTFARDGATGAVINAGTIRSRLGGYIALLAPQVRNEGLLVARAGTVAMAGGQSVRLNFGPDSTLQSLSVTPSQIATLVAKHAIKKSINVLIQRWLERNGLRPLQTPRRIEAGVKPVMLVVLEWFNAGHSIYRTHSRTLEAARERFHVVGMGLAAATDDVGRAVFDEFIEIQPGALAQQLGQIRDLAALRTAQILYMPSVGMFPLTMMLCNLRVAPVMAMALGHPATTHSQAMDVVVVEEDYVGDPACFSERLLLLPSDGMPYRPSGLASAQPDPPQIREQPEAVQVCVAASAMKINPGFLDACRRIAETSTVPLHFHFAVAFAQGLVHEQVRRVVQRALGSRATVHSHRDYPRYMDIVRDCDMFINPFPFGNTNGLIDCVTAGLVGVCRSGPEVHEHIDQGLFERLGLPDWLVARDTQSYIEAAVRLAEQHALRTELRRAHSGPDKVGRLFEGRPEIMGRKLLELLEEGDHESSQEHPARTAPRSEPAAA